RAPHLPEHPFVLGQRAYGERDDQGVVAGEQEIEHADSEEAHPELGVGEDRHHAFPGIGAARSRRHQGVRMGSTKKKSAAAVITPERGRDRKMVSEPWDMIRLWRSAFSARSPRTSASTSGASG